MQHLLGRPSAIVLRRDNGLFCGDQDFVLPVVDDCERAAAVVRAALNALNGPCQDATGALGFQQVKQIAAGLVLVGLDRASQIDRQHARIRSSGADRLCVRLDRNGRLRFRYRLGLRNRRAFRVRFRLSLGRDVFKVKIFSFDFGHKKYLLL